MEKISRNKEWPPIWLGAETDARVSEKALGIGIIEDYLNENLVLESYGRAIKELRFVIVVVKNDNNLHPDDEKYATRYHRLTIWRKLDLSIASDASQEEFLKIVALKLLEAINEIPTFGIRDFNHKAFHKDIAQVLTDEGLLDRKRA